MQEQLAAAIKMIIQGGEEEEGSFESPGEAIQTRLR
jgi:hypothetical protein